MDLEIDGNRRKILNNLDYHENPPIKGSSADNTFSIKTEQGDNVKCSHKTSVNIVPKGQKSGDKDDKGQRIIFENTQVQERDEELGRDVDVEVRTNVKDLIEHFPTKRMDLSVKEKDQISSLLEQIQKMKTGLQRLQEIAIQFNASERFTEDVNYLVNNVKPYLQCEADKESTKEKKVSPKRVK